jgi:glucan biosynthesis protein
MKRILIVIAVMAVMLSGISLFAANVGNKHPNLKIAQILIQKAMNRVTLAQKANEFDLDGHAAKAKDLLAQAYSEIKLAAETANKNAK